MSSCDFSLDLGNFIRDSHSDAIFCSISHFLFFQNISEIFWLLFSFDDMWEQRFGFWFKTISCSPKMIKSAYLCIYRNNFQPVTFKLLTQQILPLFFCVLEISFSISAILSVIPILMRFFVQFYTFIQNISENIWLLFSFKEMWKTAFFVPKVTIFSKTLSKMPNIIVYLVIFVSNVKLSQHTC